MYETAARLGGEVEPYGYRSPAAASRARAVPLAAHPGHVRSRVVQSQDQDILRGAVQRTGTTWVYLRRDVDTTWPYRRETFIRGEMCA